MSGNNYINAVYDWDTDKVLVWERGDDGLRVLRQWKAEHYFYVPEDIARSVGDSLPYSNVSGGHTSLYGKKLIRFDFDTRKEFEEGRRHFPQGTLHESDIPTELKVLMNHYVGLPTPVVNFAFLDIEVNYDSKVGFAGPKNAYAIINAITIYQSWNKDNEYGGYRQYVVPPRDNKGILQWTGTTDDIRAEFTRLMEENNLAKGIYPEIFICANESELLQRMLDDIVDADIISGWNSEFYDLPYIIKRLELVWPKLVSKMCFVGCKKPRAGEVEKFGSPEITYTIYGRSHLDYKDLFEKFTFEGRESYALANILAEEVAHGKLHYTGTLEQLYHNDFPLFCAYNFRDVSGMVDLEAKFKFIQMVNQMAHENTVNFQAMLGTVRYVETGITNFAHTSKKVIVPDKPPLIKHPKVEGAIVLTPKIGLHEFLGSVDLVSLYPTEIMSLNISPEMFRGQFAECDAAWFGIMFGEDVNGKAVAEDILYRLETDDGDFMEATAEEWRNVLIEQKWALTAYGTIFDQSGEMGLVPEVLSFWFAERKRLQGEKKKYGKLAREETDPAKKAEYERLEAHYDLLQLTKKIQLNSTYGALLNISFRFGRMEMGASVTACGRGTTTHMMQTIHQYIEKNFVRLVKTTEVEKDGTVTNAYGIDSDVIIYGDTDSCYFKTKATNNADAVRIADEVAAHVNAGWTEFMAKRFNVQPSFNGRMKAGREVVAERGLFQAKKKYVLKVVDNEGVTPSGGYKLKSQGSEIKKSDTPKIIQGFLKDLMGRILSGDCYPEVEAFVNQQRKALLGKGGDIFSMGVAKQANNLDEYYAAWIRAGHPIAGKVMLPSEMSRDGYNGTAVPGQVRAAIHYNEIVKEKEQGAKLIRGGDKVRIFYLKPNQHRWKSIGLPAELEGFPDWFDDEFVVDRKLTEEKMFDNKLLGIFNAIGWEVPTPQNTLINSILKF